MAQFSWLAALSSTQKVQNQSPGVALQDSNQLSLHFGCRSIGQFVYVLINTPNNANLHKK